MARVCAKRAIGCRDAWGLGGGDGARVDAAVCGGHQAALKTLQIIRPPIPSPPALLCVSPILEEWLPQPTFLILLSSILFPLLCPQHLEQALSLLAQHARVVEHQQQ